MSSGFLLRKIHLNEQIYIVTFGRKGRQVLFTLVWAQMQTCTVGNNCRNIYPDLRHEVQRLILTFLCEIVLLNGARKKSVHTLTYLSKGILLNSNYVICYNRPVVSSSGTCTVWKLLLRLTVQQYMSPRGIMSPSPTCTISAYVYKSLTLQRNANIGVETAITVNVRYCAKGIRC